ncbi:hypothetical protein EYF80_043228 [Liparis tanakae]|uniref:Uncharacterized protein n=1 Tax=Liparis tanakae TaxID=230148 RepID=A0A4Z2G134_9TELE|nr:hypothetical protein EYF80_043228 [Liparis tanakae]
MVNRSSVVCVAGASATPPSTTPPSATPPSATPPSSSTMCSAGFSLAAKPGATYPPRCRSRPASRPARRGGNGAAATPLISPPVLVLLRRFGNAGRTAALLLRRERSPGGPEARGAVGAPGGRALRAPVGGGVDRRGQEQHIRLLGHRRGNLQQKEEVNTGTAAGTRLRAVGAPLTLGFFLSDGSARAAALVLEGSVLLWSRSSGASRLLHGEGSDPPSSGPGRSSGSASNSGSMAASSRRGWGSGRGGRSKSEREWWRKGRS